MSKKVDSFHYQEMLQMVFVQGDMIDRHMKSHPVARKHKKIKKQLKKAIHALFVAYQLTGGYQDVDGDEAAKD
jgi:hypothetical protein